MALASGCSDRASADAAARSRSGWAIPSAHARSVTSGWPRVRVPVLSNAKTFVAASISKLAPPFSKIPLRAAEAMAEMKAEGTLMTSAQGDATVIKTMAR